MNYTKKISHGKNIEDGMSYAACSPVDVPISNFEYQTLPKQSAYYKGSKLFIYIYVEK